MVKKLLELITPKLSPVADGEAAQDAAVDAVMRRLGQLLKLSFTNSLCPPKTNSDNGTASATPVDARDPSIARVSPPSSDVAPSPLLPYSPPRTRKGNASVVAVASKSPRKGAKSKRARRSSSASVAPPPNPTPNPTHDPPPYESAPLWQSEFRSTHRPTTEFMGWRRLHLSEIVRLREGARLIVVIPSDTRSEPKSLKIARGDFRGRVLGSVLQSRPAASWPRDRRNRKNAALEALKWK